MEFDDHMKARQGKRRREEKMGKMELKSGMYNSLTRLKGTLRN